SGRLAVTVIVCTGLAVGVQAPIWQSSGQLSSTCRFPSSQLSGTVTLLFPQMVQNCVHPSFGFRFPSSHSSPASVIPLPHNAGVVVDVVDPVAMVVVVVM